MITAFLDPLVDLVLPRSCAGCGRPGTGWCVTCRGAIDPRFALLSGLPVVAATAYAGAVRRALLAYKEGGRRDLAGPLGAVLAAAIRPLLAAACLSPQQVLVVCVPSTRSAAARRGGEHVARLATRAAPSCGVRLSRGLLHVRRDVLDSAGLGAAERARNMSGAMRAVPTAHGVAARRVIVVDDIVSSGSTMLEACRALELGGWPVAGAAAVAATPPTGAGASVRWSRQFPGRPLAAPR